MKKAMLLLGVLCLLVVLSGCGRFDRWFAGWTGNSETCVDGVKYLQFTSGVTVKYNPNGTIVTCGMFN